jgi:hypothetical protein
VETTTLAVAERENHVEFLIGFGVPEGAVWLTIAGPRNVHPPGHCMTKPEFASWLKKLETAGYTIRARDGSQNSVPIPGLTEPAPARPEGSSDQSGGKKGQGE